MALVTLYEEGDRQYMVPLTSAVGEMLLNSKGKTDHVLQNAETILDSYERVFKGLDDKKPLGLSVGLYYFHVHPK